MKRRDKEEEVLYRFAALIVSGIIFYFWTMLVIVLFFINFIIVLFKGKPNLELVNFAKIWVDEINRLYKYLLFISDERPFPFNSPKDSK